MILENLNSSFLDIKLSVRVKSEIEASHAFHIVKRDQVLVVFKSKEKNVTEDQDEKFTFDTK